MRFLPAVILPIVWAVLSAWWTPRGPLTNAEALWSIAISAGVGVLAGRAVRSRWVILSTPLLYALTLELARLRVSGPSVDMPQPTSFGFLALVTGRGVHGLLTLLPLVLGVMLGNGLRRRWKQVAVVVPLLAVAVVVAIPARTAPIPGGVAELAMVSAGDHELGVMIRGRDESAPVLLFVPGTPGGSEKAAMRRHLAGLEKHFVVATLDRRGGGASYQALDPTVTVTLDDAVADVTAVTDHLRGRFRQERIVMLAFSGGSILGALAVKQHPEKYRAYVGTGQAVDLEASDQIFYDDILAWARAGGRAEVADQLAAQGRPPYADFWSYEPFMLYENQVYDQGDPVLEISADELTLLEKAHTMVAIMDTWSALYPRMQDTDLRRDVTSLEVPAYFIQGGNEMRGLSEVFAEWYPALVAPDKRLITIPGAGHRAMFERPDVLVATLAELFPRR
ncbi:MULTISPECIES: alpha/beta hydrolase [Actinoplanes]|uniref:alpha/beta fold hydrolase n=1 Tax=Actinoplanes TaxID=1865 RepID=UPI0005F2FD05|nr:MULTISPECIES: alpha/beta hydrolase [Actinoplanes]